jgi:hypothetical protein
VSDGSAHFGLSDPFVVEPNTDADHDGLPDAWQNRYFGQSRVNAGPNDDPDHDGLTNLQELLGGTNPLDSVDVIRITSVRVVGSDVHLQFQTVKGRGYIVERAADPANGSWAVLSQVTAGANGSATVIDPGGAAHAVQFYRIRLLR